MTKNLIDKAIERLPITDEDIERELNGICDRTHSGCNRDCPVYLLYDGTPGKGDYCSCHLNGAAMLSLLRAAL